MLESPVSVSRLLIHMCLITQLFVLHPIANTSSCLIQQLTRTSNIMARQPATMKTHGCVPEDLEKQQSSFAQEYLAAHSNCPFTKRLFPEAMCCSISSIKHCLQLHHQVDLWDQSQIAGDTHSDVKEYTHRHTHAYTRIMDTATTIKQFRIGETPTTNTFYGANHKSQMGDTDSVKVANFQSACEKCRRVAGPEKGYPGHSALVLINKTSSPRLTSGNKKSPLHLILFWEKLTFFMLPFMVISRFRLP